ncbi:hypothetical protein PGT21_014194 [Puccinia graminis f. sp. tritici]|uniref:Uncharacterized protein n=1 Tax=Puccinia graminis f. sp. tritici TaxID=56615 RepID=A0A5B0N0K3_PUCGR|nr:hypothetical protein PGT21_014194 [Puccinia graminis f. sp. tritici]KAA1088014.1 hypothetical protein PGTUg99_018848 [Puccinia graminis f. sp. tritici]
MFSFFHSSSSSHPINEALAKIKTHSGPPPLHSVPRPFGARRSTQIVGRLELEPAPLLEADNEEDDTSDEDIETNQTDTGTKLGEV